jgi:probable phosphomutase (TIGR03848 family)
MSHVTEPLWGLTLLHVASMTTFLLIRHALCDPVGKAIAGRAAGIHLNRVGKEQADRLAVRLEDVAISAVYSSPLERALETAAPFAARKTLPVQVTEGLNEIDFGDWTGRTLAELDRLPEWRAFNSFRSGTRIPGGETMMEVLARATAEVERLQAAHPASTDVVALVSHGDVLRGIVCHALGIAPDLLQRIELSPASVSVLVREGAGNRVLLLNSTGDWPSELRPLRR